MGDFINQWKVSSMKQGILWYLYLNGIIQAYSLMQIKLYFNVSVYRYISKINTMKHIRNSIIVLLIVASTFPHLGFSQDSLSFDLSCEVHTNYPPLSITRETLTEAHTLIDLNANYPSAWVREYIVVEIETSYKGKIRKVMGKNDTLTQEQKGVMNSADPGTEISVKVQYIPENNLTHNDKKEISFAFLVDPENAALFPGGQQQLKKYLKENVIDKVSDDSFRRYQLAVVKFTIDEDGQVSNPHIFWPSEDGKTDNLLLETISNMPNWKPAEYSNGLKVKQEFALTVGDMESCTVHLLNTRQNKLLD